MSWNPLLWDAFSRLGRRSFHVSQKRGSRRRPRNHNHARNRSYVFWSYPHPTLSHSSFSPNARSIFLSGLHHPKSSILQAHGISCVFQTPDVKYLHPIATFPSPVVPGNPQQTYQEPDAFLRYPECQGPLSALPCSKTASSKIKYTHVLALLADKTIQRGSLRMSDYESSEALGQMISGRFITKAAQTARGLAPSLSSRPRRTRSLCPSNCRR
jgi:hypothetical protein